MSDPAVDSSLWYGLRPSDALLLAYDQISIAQSEWSVTYALAMKEVNRNLETRDWNGSNDLAIRHLLVDSLPFGDERGNHFS